MDTLRSTALLAALSSGIATAGPPQTEAPSRPLAEESALRWGDYDGDGLSDILSPAPGGGLMLLHNLGDGTFDDVSTRAGLDHDALPNLRSVEWVDFDADGRLDVFALSRAGGARFMRQRASHDFIDVSDSIGPDDTGSVLGARWLDFDNDGRLDLELETAGEYRLYHNAPRSLVEVVRIPRGTALGTSSKGPATDDPEDPVVVLPPGATRGQAALPGALGRDPEQPVCTPSIQDAAVMGYCMQASSIPMLGKLYPLSSNFFVDSGTGNVGVGTTSPIAKLEVEGGSIRTDAQLISTTTSGPPLDVASMTKVVGLNADLLDGLHASAFSQIGNTIGTNEIEDGAITRNKVATGAISSEKIAPGAVGSSQVAVATINDAHVNELAGIDGSKIVPNFDGNVTTSAYVGAGTDSPDVSLHVVGSPTLGAAMIAPRETVAGGDSEILLAEDDNGTFGMKFLYDGAANQLQILSRSNDVDDSSPDVVIERETGNMSIGSDGTQLGKLTVSGADDPASYAVEVLGGTGPGLHVSSTSPSDLGLLAETASGTQPAILGTGSFRGVSGETTSSATNGAGVHGLATPLTGTTYGVFGEALSSAGYGVFGRTDSTSGVSYGVAGTSLSSSGRGVAGNALSTSGLNYGVRGFTASAAGWGVFASGNMGASGTKSFINPHPEDPSKEIRFVCLEGNESGTYFRGSATLVGGMALITVPEEFRLASESDSVTVQVSPRGRAALLWVESSDNSEILVKGEPDVEFDYFVNGLRRGYRDVQLIHENSTFVPEFEGVPYGTQYPDGIQRLLVQNGTLHPDLTPRKSTADAIGWSLRPAGQEAR